MLLSIELEISEICKSKAPVFAQFRSKIIRTSFDGCKTVKRSREKYFLQILLKKYRIYWQKTWTGCERNVKFGMQSDFFVLYKNPQNNFFLPGPFHCANISQIFYKYFHLSDHHKIFGASFYRSHSTRPTIFFTSFLQPAGIATDSFENRSSAMAVFN